MKIEQIKNELQMDKNLIVIGIENCGDCFIHENVAIINYNGNGYRIIFDEKYVLVQMLMIGDIDKNGNVCFDEACDYIGNHHIIGTFETVAEIVKSQIEYCEWKFGKFTDYDY